jgi:hypothetical protein
MSEKIKVGVAYSEPAKQAWLNVDLDEGATVEDAISKSGILNMFPHIDLTSHKVGVFGKLCKLDARVKPGDRVEIYRAITADPKTVKRRDMADDDDD